MLSIRLTTLVSFSEMKQPVFCGYLFIIFLNCNKQIRLQMQNLFLFRMSMNKVQLLSRFAIKNVHKAIFMLCAKCLVRFCQEYDT